MRILHVNNIANVGPVLVQGLRGLGHKADFYDLMRPGANAYYPLKVLLSPFRFLEYTKLNSYIKSNSFNIVHIHFASQGIAGVIGRYPFFLHVHGSDVHKNLRIPLISQLTKMAIQKAELVFYSTPNLEEYVRPLRQDAVFLPNPIQHECRPARRRRSDAIKVLIFMRLDPIKIDRTVFAALSELCARDDVEITALQWGSQYKRYREEFTSIEFIPTVPYYEVMDLLDRFDVVIGQLRQGALGVSELEAMCAGIPVIGYFAYPDAYPEPPPILQTESADEVINHIICLLHDEELRAEVGGKAQEWVFRYHNINRICKQLVEEYLIHYKDNEMGH